MIMPQAHDNQYGDPAWQDLYEPGLRDFNFIEDILDTAILKHNADPEPLYLTGFSNGGFMNTPLAKQDIYAFDILCNYFKTRKLSDKY